MGFSRDGGDRFIAEFRFVEATRVHVPIRPIGASWRQVCRAVFVRESYTYPLEAVSALSTATCDPMPLRVVGSFANMKTTLPPRPHPAEKAKKRETLTTRMIF